MSALMDRSSSAFSHRSPRAVVSHAYTPTRAHEAITRMTVTIRTAMAAPRFRAALPCGRRSIAHIALRAACPPPPHPAPRPRAPGAREGAATSSSASAPFQEARYRTDVAQCRRCGAPRGSAQHPGPAPARLLGPLPLRVRSDGVIGAWRERARAPSCRETARRRHATLLALGVGSPQRADVELLHLHHRLHHASRALGIGILDELEQRRRDDLPGQAEPVLEPPALTFLSAAGRELPPQLVHLLLRLAVDHERDRLGELEVWPAVQGD